MNFERLFEPLSIWIETTDWPNNLQKGIRIKWCSGSLGLFQFNILPDVLISKQMNLEEYNFVVMKIITSKVNFELIEERNETSVKRE